MSNISILNKEKCRIFLLEKGDTLRQMYADAFKRAEYQLITPFSEKEELTDKLKNEYVDWCVLSLDSFRGLNLTEILENLFSSSNNSDLLISFINDKVDDNLLPILFESGIFCNFEKSYTIAPFEEQLSFLLKYVHLYKGDFTLISAEYIRSSLKRRKFYGSLLDFEDALQEVYPGNHLLLIKLCEAQCLNSKYGAAVSSLAQAEFIEPKSKPAADLLRKKYLKLMQEDNVAIANNILGIKDCLIIDPDTDIHHNVIENLSKLGISECQCFENGDLAYKYLETNIEPKLIIMEWKIPIISGVALIQRIRTKLGFNQCMIMIISSLIKKHDLSLLQEMGVDAVLEKPFDASQLAKELIGIIHHSLKPSEQRSLERKIRLFLANNKTGEAERMIAEYVNIPEISNGAKLQIRAEYEYSLNRFDDALNHGLEALKLCGKSVILLTLLGKCFLKIKDFKNASSAFKNAHELSPYNVDRMLTLISLYIEDGSLEKATEILQKVKTVDEKRQDVIEIECRLAIEKSETSSATKLFQMLDSLSGIVGMINNDAVSRIHSGKYEQGIKLYHQALKSLPEDSIEYCAIVNYNLGLAYARYGDLDQCLNTLIKINPPSTIKIHQKYLSLQEKVRTSINNGTKLEFQEMAVKKVESVPAEDKVTYTFEEIIKKFGIKKGLRCCYKIYYRSEDVMKL
ncbi:tetratricopeptide repeat protein [Fluviispira multicolorata]|uniref:Response regulator n=1 Tax=Fluviispira multicolorata TaxID=2654512 RepID=A0A833JHP8_9BACT|nr:response regulator [Fluviispira multicolorata]KAB8033628.1 response regulator [Fluviispira multicolorata]